MHYCIARRIARALTLALVGITLVPGAPVSPNGFAPARAALTVISATADYRRYRTRRGGAAVHAGV